MPLRITGGAIEASRNLAALLTNLEPNDVLFIDEIHRLSRSVEEILYPALEDFALDILIGKSRGEVRKIRDRSARSARDQRRRNRAR